MAASTAISLSYRNPLQDRMNEDFFKNLPRCHGVYYFLDREGLPLYIGKANDLRRRLTSYVSAKPGRVGEHILEMLDHAVEIRWEEHPDEAAALKREAELIRSVRPKYNIALNWDVPYLYIGLKVTAPKTAGKASAANRARIEFNLSHYELPSDFHAYGCFRHRGRVKTGYSALLRLLYAATCDRQRFNWPAKICRSAPAYVYTTEIPQEWVTPLMHFFEGRNSNLLQILLTRLLEQDNLQKHFYASVQRDFYRTREFYKMGPRDTRRLAKKLNTRSRLVPQEAMDRLVKDEFRDMLKAPAPNSSDTTPHGDLFAKT